jgi:hypothetical protein
MSVVKSVTLFSAAALVAAFAWNVPASAAPPLAQGAAADLGRDASHELAYYERRVVVTPKRHVTKKVVIKHRPIAKPVVIAPAPRVIVTQPRTKVVKRVVIKRDTPHRYGTYRVYR